MRQELQTVVDSLESEGFEVSVEEVENHNENAESIHTRVDGVEFEFYYETGERDVGEDKDEVWEVESRDDALVTDVWQSFTAPEGAVEMTKLAISKSDEV